VSATPCRPCAGLETNAFAAVKSKNAKKKNAEFLKKNQDLINSARAQAEAMKSAGEAHL
jgi:hypothetical protein